MNNNFCVHTADLSRYKFPISLPGVGILYRATFAVFQQKVDRNMESLVFDTVISQKRKKYIYCMS